MPAWAGAQQAVRFHWFEYSGHDAAFAQPLPPGHYRNPVLAGFHPDPSVVRVGDRFYLVNSSFAWFPGIPVFESRDLVHWRQIGNVIERPSQFDYDGLGVSRGMFAPSIAFHAGTFYVVDTAVDGSGTFLATATDPAGPWSDPKILPGIDGIDPSLFFDDDGKAYLLNNGPPQGKPLYKGHRAIWMQAFDVARRRPVGPRKVVLNGGVDLSRDPIWIEGPHLHKRGGWYYLSCAEGGTGPQHSQVVLRSRSPWGPYQPYAHNPILTQRDLPADRAHPIVDAGHADLVQGPDGSWWAVFLASRAYGRTHFNTGRETFLLPVHWKDGWPIILEHGQVVPQVVAAPGFMRGNAPQAPLSGNFSWRDDFDETTLGHAWMTLRAPRQAWVDLTSSPGNLSIHPLAEGLDSPHDPSFLARRQQHLVFDASTALDVPTRPGIAAGIVAFQNGAHWYFLGVHRVGDHVELFLKKRDGGAVTTVAHTRIEPDAPLQLRISGDGGAYAFAYDTDGKGWRWLRRDEDGTILSTDVAGGFVGTMLGPYARIETSP
ncbi:glycoside hydrolase family 43 protein [Rhodanobacter sp. 115]|uniref:glycoside hydrolase family 43 protein n=1 Tax=Rhodanobacter sp. FW021-MT20 TaxID=1162282 RepID=UPI0006806B46|nr:glycoside hydrolase family 43 protein [Rhodanobacter sp. 115]